MLSSTLNALTLSALVSFAAALEITSPTADTIFSPTNFTITWQRNSTLDPAHINIDLVNSDNSGFQSHSLGTNITVLDFSYTVPSSNIAALSGVTDGSGWQININSVAAEGSAFVTQSEDFTVADVDAAASSSSSSSASSSSATSNSSSSSGIVGGVSSASASASSAAASASASATSLLSSASASASSALSSISSSATSGASSATSTGSTTASAAQSTSTSSGLAAIATGNVKLTAGGLMGAAALALLV